MMMIIIIALIGANRDFLQSPYCVANSLQHVRSNGQATIVNKSRLTHRAFITWNMSRATSYEGTAHLLSLTEFKSHLFELYFIGDGGEEEAGVPGGNPWRSASIVHAAALKQNWQIKLATSPIHSILTPGQPVQAPNL